MSFNIKIHATKESLEQLVAKHPKNEPVVMVNILRYFDKTESGDETGEEAYARYGMNAFPFLKKAGARILWRGTVSQVVIGEQNDQPHEIILVRYPSVQHFIDMAFSDEYIKLSKDRNIALEYGGLIAAQSVMGDLV